MFSQMPRKPLGCYEVPLLRLLLSLIVLRLGRKRDGLLGLGTIFLLLKFKGVTSIDLRSTLVED